MVTSLTGSSCEYTFAEQGLAWSDQATLFVYFGPECWCKAGLEYDKDILWNGPVVVNPWSDWYVPASPEPLVVPQRTDNQVTFTRSQQRRACQSII